MTCTVALPNATVGYSMIISIKVNRDSVCVVLVWSVMQREPIALVQLSWTLKAVGCDPS